MLAEKSNPQADVIWDGPSPHGAIIPMGMLSLQSQGSRVERDSSTQDMYAGIDMYIAASVSTQGFEGQEPPGRRMVRSPSPGFKGLIAMQTLQLPGQVFCRLRHPPDVGAKEGKEEVGFLKPGQEYGQLLEWFETGQEYGSGEFAVGCVFRFRVVNFKKQGARGVCLSVEARL